MNKENHKKNDINTILIIKGLVPALSGIMPYAGVDLAVYSTLKDKYFGRKGIVPGPLSLLSMNN